MSWLALAISSLAAMTFAALGILLGRRPMEDEMRPAWNLFRTWWFSVAAITAMKPLRVMLYAADTLPVWLYVTLRQMELVGIAVALWALLCYLLYAYRGSRRGWGALGVAYGLLAFALLGILAAAGEPERLVLVGGEVVAEPGIDLGRVATFAVLAVLVVPQIIAALTYSRLYFRVDQAAQKFRIGLVSLAIVGWFAVRLAGAALDAQGPAWQVIGAILGLAAALLVMVAYFPPKSLRQKYGVRTLGQDAV